MSVQAIGVSVALRAQEWLDLSPTDQQAFTLEAFSHLEHELRRFTGEATPKGLPTHHADGPHDDPLQGPIYIWTTSAPYETDDLPADCRAYATHHVQRRESEARP